MTRLRILHFYTADDRLVQQHVDMLSEKLAAWADCHAATEISQARTLLGGGHYDMLHLHGCWHSDAKEVVHQALAAGARLVVSPHGGLTPWEMSERRWVEKAPKTMLYQRDIIRKAYAVIVHGRVEQESVRGLGWNPRTVEIRNAVVTGTITPDEMARQTWTVYRQVADSNPWERMDDTCRATLRNILKAGITGDRRWLTEPVEAIAPSAWRLLLLYAHQEEIDHWVLRGIRVLDLNAPETDASQCPCFWPENYQRAETLGALLGNQFVSENERLTATFRLIRKLSLERQLSIKHLAELDEELRRHDCVEDKLEESLKDHRLWKLARRTMQLMSQRTGLTEGFMPVPPLDDRTTRRMARHVANRLSIHDK